METLEAIFTRRSIRQFTDERVSEEMVEKLLRAAMNAPSANNRQSWHFIVVNEREKLNKIAEIHQYGKMCAHAPLAFICCHDETLEDVRSYGIQNVSAAIQNMLLATRDIGLGGVWLGVYPRDERVKEFQVIFHMPDHILPVGVVFVGHTDKEQTYVDRYQPSRVHYNSWE